MGDADKLSIPQLQQSIQNGTIPAYIGVPLLQEKVKQQKAMQASMAAPQGPAKPPVAQQVMQEAQGVSALPSNLPEEGYADGGIVAFAGNTNGSYVTGRTMADQLKELLAQQDAALYGEYGNTGWTPEEIAKYKQAGWSDADIAKYKSPGPVRINNPSVSKYPTIQVPEGGFNAQTNLPALYKQGQLSPAYTPKAGVPATIPSPAASAAVPPYKAGVPGVIDPWSGGLLEDSKLLANAKAALGKAGTAAGKVGSAIGKAGSAIATPLTAYDVGESYAADPRLLLAAAGNDKAKEAIKSGDIKLPGAVEGLLTHGIASGPAFDAYRFLKGKFADTPAAKPDTGYDGFVGRPDIKVSNQEQFLWDVLKDPASTDPKVISYANKYFNQHPDAYKARMAEDHIPYENLQEGVVGKDGVGGAGGYGAGSTGFAQVPSYNIAMPEFDTEGYKALQYSPEELDKVKAINEAKGFYGTDPEAAKLAEKIKGREADLAGEKDKAPWMALMQAGLATMAGTSPFALTNIGAGGQAGLEAFTKAKDKFEDRQDKLYEMQGRLADKKRAEELAAINHGINSVEHKEAANRTAKQAELTAKADYAYRKAQVGIQNAELGIKALEAQSNAGYKRGMVDYYAQKGSGATKYNSEQAFIQDILDNKDAPFNAKYFDAEGNFDRGRAIAEYNRLKKQNLLDVSNGMDIFGGADTQEAPAPQFKLRSIKSQ